MSPHSTQFCRLCTRNGIFPKVWLEKNLYILICVSYCEYIEFHALKIESNFWYTFIWIYTRSASEDDVSNKDQKNNILIDFLMWYREWARERERRWIGWGFNRVDALTQHTSEWTHARTQQALASFQIWTERKTQQSKAKQNIKKKKKTYEVANQCVKREYLEEMKDLREIKMLSRLWHNCHGSFAYAWMRTANTNVCTGAVRYLEQFWRRRRQRQQ